MLVINGRTYTSTYTQSTRLLSTTTPSNRTSQVTLDAKGRVIQEQVTGLDAVSYTYTANGELLTKTVSGQTTNYTYDVLGNLKTVVLPGGTTTIDYVVDGQNRRIGTERSTGR